MKQSLRLTLLAGLIALLAIASVPLLRAQNAPTPAPGAQQGPNGGRGGRRGFDLARMAERIKENLDATDDEWKVIQPLVTDVLQTRMKVEAGMFRMFRGRGGQGGPGAQGGQGGQGGPAGPGNMMPSDPAADALSAAADNDATSKAELQTRLKAYRDEKKKNEAALKASREKLRAVLTLRQEAKLVLMGLLD